MMKMDEWLATGEMLKREAPSMALKYPHILERLQYLWSEPEDCRMCFKKILMMDSIERQGFPVEVMEELMRLHNIYESSYSQGAQLQLDDYSLLRGCTG